MNIGTKVGLKDKARLARGFISILSDDVTRLYTDIEDNDTVDMDESIRDVKETLQCLIDITMEIEYMIYLAKRESRK